MTRSGRPIEDRLRAESGRGVRETSAKQGGRNWFRVVGYQLKEGQENEQETRA